MTKKDVAFSAREFTLIKYLRELIYEVDELKKVGV